MGIVVVGNVFVMNLLKSIFGFSFIKTTFFVKTISVYKGKQWPL